MEKVKTGILPAGGFYSIYELVCHDQSTVSIARTQRGRRWCTSYEGELNCGSLSDVTRAACAYDDVASNSQRVVDQIEGNQGMPQATLGH